MQEHPIWDVDRIMIDMRICWTLIEYKNGMFHDIPIMKRALQNVHFTYILQDVIFYIFRVLHGCKYIYIYRIRAVIEFLRRVTLRKNPPYLTLVLT